MVEHHPMDRLHRHLAEAAGHAVNVHQEAQNAVTAHLERSEQERKNGVSNLLTPDEER